jgi:hypothetical protein
MAGHGHEQPQPPTTHLAVAVAVTAVAGTALLLDLTFAGFQVPLPVTNASLAASLGAWIFWHLTRLIGRSQYRMENRLELASWAEGYVSGVARRTPPSDRVRYMEE